MHANVVFAHDLIESLRSFLLIQKNQNFNPTTGGNQEPNMPVCRSFSLPPIWLGPTRRHGIKSCAWNESIQHKIE